MKSADSNSLAASERRGAREYELNAIEQGHEGRLQVAQPYQVIADGEAAISENVSLK